MEEHLNTSAAGCRKNPGHVQFTPTSDFKPSHLPDSVQSQLVWALMYHKARLTVMLVVNYVSPNRPAEFREEFSNRNIGSGYVTDIDRSSPDSVEITINTAAHVVFDDQEAENTIAKFYFHRKQQVFQIRHARLLAVNPRKDTSTIIFTLDLESLYCLASPSDLWALEYALSPSVLPNVNDKMNISLLQSVVARYKTASFTWLSFLFSDIKCLRNIRFVSNETRVLEIEVNISLILLYDIILLIIALASRHNNLMNFVHLINFMEDVARRDDIHLQTAPRPFVTLSKEMRNNDNVANSVSKLSLHQFINTDNKPICMINNNFNIQQNKELLNLMTCLLPAVNTAELNEALTDFCGFDISARLKRSGVIVFEIPVASVNIPDKMSLDIHLHDVMVEDEDNQIAVLIAHPHDMPQQITTGQLEHSPTSGKMSSYTTPSCPGSSGGQLLIIPRDPKSLEELENIDVLTHSCASLVRGFGN